jgi:hypothetical protein
VEKRWEERERKETKMRRGEGGIGRTDSAQVVQLIALESHMNRGGPS